MPPDPAEQTVRFRPPRGRAVAGILALALVVVLEVTRRTIETSMVVSEESASAIPPGDAAPVTVPIAPTLPPAPPSPTPSAARRAAARPPGTRPIGSLESASRASPSAAPARLLIDFRHGIRRGSLAVSVDGETRIEQPLSSRVTRRLLSMELRRGRVREAIPVPPGSRRIRVQVRWDGQYRADTAVATFREGRTRRLVARLAPLTRALLLDWE